VKEVIIKLGRKQLVKKSAGWRVWNDLSSWRCRSI